MTREEMIKEMKDIEARRFYLRMKDRWVGEDFLTDSKLFTEWMKLKRELEKTA